MEHGGGLVNVLERLAARHGITVEEGSIRRAQVVKWLDDVERAIPDGAVSYVERELERLEKWPHWFEFRDACARGRKRWEASAWGTSSDPCGPCRDTGYVSFVRRLEAGGPAYPWAAACLCSAGERVPSHIVRVDPDVFHAQRLELARGDRGEERHELDELALLRRAAALRYIVVSFRIDPEPVRMVEALLAGDRDDVARTILAGRGGGDGGDAAQ